jgi:hypothetical protein
MASWSLIDRGWMCIRQEARQHVRIQYKHYERLLSRYYFLGTGPWKGDDGVEVRELQQSVSEQRSGSGAVAVERLSLRRARPSTRSVSAVTPDLHVTH